MNKSFKQVFLVTAVCLGTIVGGIWLLSLTLGNNHETLYQGKPSSYWLAQFNSQNAAASNQAVEVLNSQIIPRLTDRMVHDTNDSSFRMAFVDRLNQLPGITILYSPAMDRREQAANELADFGPAAKAAIPGLVQSVKGNDAFSRYLAISVLGDIHSEPDVVIPLLMPYLDDNNSLEMTMMAAQALGKFGGLAKPAVPKIISLLKIHNPKAQEIFQGALNNIAPEAMDKAGVR